MTTPLIGELLTRQRKRMGVFWGGEFRKEDSKGDERGEQSERQISRTE